MYVIHLFLMKNAEATLLPITVYVTHLPYFLSFQYRPFFKRFPEFENWRYFPKCFPLRKCSIVLAFVLGSNVTQVPFFSPFLLSLLGHLSTFEFATIELLIKKIKQGMVKNIFFTFITKAKVTKFVLQYCISIELLLIQTEVLVVNKNYHSPTTKTHPNQAKHPLPKVVNYSLPNYSYCRLGGNRRLRQTY